MKYYYHEKERIMNLFKNPNRVKTPLTVYLGDRSKVSISPSDFRALSSMIGTDKDKIKGVFSSKGNISSFFKIFSENIKIINNNKSRR